MTIKPYYVLDKDGYNASIRFRPRRLLRIKWMWEIMREQQMIEAWSEWERQARDMV